jgi:hypothetical protein
MDLGRLSTILPARPAYPHTGPASRDAGPRPVEPASLVAPERDSYTRTRPAEPVIEGELLRRRPGYGPSTQDFLGRRQYQEGSAETQHGAGRGLSTGNRQALGLYLNNIHPEPRQSFTTGRSVDAFV